MDALLRRRSERLWLSGLVVFNPMLDTAFFRFFRRILLCRCRTRKSKHGDRCRDQESFLLMHAWYTMSPKDCAGNISLLLSFQLASQA